MKDILPLFFVVDLWLHTQGSSSNQQWTMSRIFKDVLIKYRTRIFYKGRGELVNHAIDLFVKNGAIGIVQWFSSNKERAMSWVIKCLIIIKDWSKILLVIYGFYFSVLQKNHHLLVWTPISIVAKAMTSEALNVSGSF